MKSGLRKSFPSKWPREVPPAYKSLRKVVSGDHFPAGGPGRPRQRTHLCENSPLKAIPRQLAQGGPASVQIYAKSGCHSPFTSKCRTPCHSLPCRAFRCQALPCSAVPRYALPRSIAWDSTGKHLVALRSMAKHSVAQHSMHGVVNNGQSQLSVALLNVARHTIGKHK